MAIETLYPAIRPSLNLDFANSKVLDPRITFGRASAATYYDGKTVAKAEENLLTYSQQITAGVGAWAGQGLATGTAINSAQAPDITVTASTINVTSGAGGVRYYSTIPAGTYTVSVYIRSVSGSTDFAIDFENLYSTSFTLSSVWQRVTATVTFAVTRAWIDFQISAPGIFEIWGAQLEQRSQVTAYTPTTSQPITNYIPVLQTAPAGVPRFDHNPVTGESLGLLVEEQRTNLYLNSSEFSLAYWNKLSSTVEPNVTVAPDGTQTADALVCNANAVYYCYRPTAVAGVQTISMYMKAAKGTFGGLYCAGTTNTSVARYNLQTGVVAGVTNGGLAAITPVGNGWYRCSLTYDAVAGGNVGFATEGVIGDSVYIWGVQLETGAFPTSYIKTEASQVTRVADSASMIGANFSSWYRQDEGTLCAELSSTSNALPQNGGIASLVDAASVLAGSVVLYASTVALAATVYAGGQLQATMSLAVVNSANSKAAVSYAFNDIRFCCNGSEAQVDSTAMLPSVNSLAIGRWAGNPGALTGRIKRLSYYPKRLSNAQLQALTA